MTMIPYSSEGVHRGIYLAPSFLVQTLTVTAFNVWNLVWKQSPVSSPREIKALDLGRYELVRDSKTEHVDVGQSLGVGSGVDGRGECCGLAHASMGFSHRIKTVEDVPSTTKGEERSTSVVVEG